MKVRGRTVYTAEERIARLSIPEPMSGRRSQRKGRRRISSALILTRIGWVDWRYADKMESGNERD